VKLAFAVLAALAAAAACGVAGAQGQTRPIRVISEYNAGAGGDVFFRPLAKHLATATEQQWIVDNRGGAGGLLAVEAVMRAAPDGQTVLLASQNVPVTRRYLTRGRAIDPLQDLTPISALWRTTLVIAAHPSLPVKSLSELILYAKARPGKLGYTTSGIGTQAHFAGLSLTTNAGIALVHIPYNNSRQVQDVVSGEVPLTISIVSSVAVFARSGRLRPLAIAAARRIEALPDVPAATEFLPDFEPPPTWTGLFAPAGLPRPVLARLNAGVVKALAAPEARARAGADGFQLIANTPEEFAEQIRRDIEVTGRLVKAAGITPTD
jgi:tripartite-type tricarboxylate transporter receptor subunit TctC